MAQVTVADRSLAPAQVAAAVDAAAGTGQALRSLAAALAGRAARDMLADGAPPGVGRLVTELIARGSAEFTAPACKSCGTTGRPLTRSSSGGVCPRCRNRLLAVACGRCGGVKPVADRTGAGEPVCERCRRHERGHRPCGTCRKTTPIAVRGRGGVCVNCYRMPQALCTACGRRRPCNFAEGGNPVCKTCTPRATSVCARCGQDRPAAARWPEGPVCDTCYTSALRRRGACTACYQQRQLARVELWSREVLDAISETADRRLVQAYLTWQVLQRLRRRSQTSPGPRTVTGRARHQILAVVAFLTWLRHHDLTLASCGQGDAETWLATGPAAYDIRDFLAWAAARKHAGPLSSTSPPSCQGCIFFSRAPTCSVGPRHKGEVRTP